MLPKFWFVIVFLVENIQVENVSHCLEWGMKKNLYPSLSLDKIHHIHEVNIVMDIHE